MEEARPLSASISLVWFRSNQLVANQPQWTSLFQSVNLRSADSAEATNYFRVSEDGLGKPPVPMPINHFHFYKPTSCLIPFPESISFNRPTSVRQSAPGSIFNWHQFVCLTHAFLGLRTNVKTGHYKPRKISVVLSVCHK